MERKLASIQKIKDIQPIPDADNIEVATVLGWRCVIKKGEFEVGDLCVYFEIDSLIPITSWSIFLEDKNKPGQPVRLRTRKLRKQISQGLVAHINILGDCVTDENKVEGFDVTELLGVEKYEAPIPASLSGRIRGAFPALVYKTDEIRLQSEPELIQEFQGKQVYWSVKMDGTSGTFAHIMNDLPVHVCSRNFSLLMEEGNTYWKMYDQYKMNDVFRDAGEIAIQGEICGEGIQKNRMGIKGQQLFIFNIFDIRAHHYFGLSEMQDFCSTYKLQMVPVEKVEVFNYQTVDELVELATQCKYPNGALGEGYVIRPVINEYSPVLNSMASFKVINNKYLAKHEE